MQSGTTVVTGATGHLGTTLTKTLVASGKRVRALMFSDPTPLAGLDIERVPCDVRDPAQVFRALEGADTVYHLAGLVALDGDYAPYEALNVEGTRNVVGACLARGVRRLVHVSSVHAMCNDDRSRPVDESRPLVGHDHPLSYARSKAQGEREVERGRALGLDAVIVAPTAVIGPDDHRPSAMGRVLLDLYQERWPVNLDTSYDWVDVRDVVSGAVAAAERAPRGAKYILSGHWASIPDLARTMQEVTGRRAPRVVLPGWAAVGAGHLATAGARLLRKRPFFSAEEARVTTGPRQTFDHGLARRELGYSPRPLRETLTDLYACFRRRGVIAA